MNISFREILVWICVLCSRWGLGWCNSCWHRLALHLIFSRYPPLYKHNGLRGCGVKEGRGWSKKCWSFRDESVARGAVLEWNSCVIHLVGVGMFWCCSREVSFGAPSRHYQDKVWGVCRLNKGCLCIACFITGERWTGPFNICKESVLAIFRSKMPIFQELNQFSGQSTFCHLHVVIGWHETPISLSIVSKRLDRLLFAKCFVCVIQENMMLTRHEPCAQTRFYSNSAWFHQLWGPILLFLWLFSFRISNVLRFCLAGFSDREHCGTYSIIPYMINRA